MHDVKIVALAACLISQAHALSCLAILSVCVDSVAAFGDARAVDRYRKIL